MGYVLAVVKDMDENEVRRIGNFSPGEAIIAVSSIKRAKKIVSAIVPDAVVIEPELEDGAGIGFLNFLANHPRLSHVPVITLRSRGTRRLIA